MRPVTLKRDDELLEATSRVLSLFPMHGTSELRELNSRMSLLAQILKARLDELGLTADPEEDLEVVGNGGATFASIDLGYGISLEIGASSVEIWLREIRRKEDWGIVPKYPVRLSSGPSIEAAIYRAASWGKAFDVVRQASTNLPK